MCVFWHVIFTKDERKLEASNIILTVSEQKTTCWFDQSSYCSLFSEYKLLLTIFVLLQNEYFYVYIFLKNISNYQFTN